VKEFLNKYGLWPKKHLGQHFLICESELKKMIEASNITTKDTVIEVGPGTGILTKALAQKAKQIIAVEKDRQLASALQENIRADTWGTNVTVIQKDILKFDPKDFMAEDESYILVGDIPYYLSSRLFRHFLTKVTRKPQKIILMLQKEVAERVCAEAPHTNLLALSVQVFGEPRIVTSVPKKCFWPEPRVESTILVVEKISDEFFTKNNIEQEKFFMLLKKGFAQKRKKLINNLADAFKIQKSDLETTFEKCEVDNSARAENLDLQQWTCLYGKIS